MDAVEIAGLMVGGLGLFFIGVRLIGSNLRLMAGKGFRLFLIRLTNRPVLSAFTGVFSGAVTQSTSAVTFIMTGMISAGLVSFPRAMPLVLWSNVGNCILVFLAVINFHIMVLYLLGIIGFMYYLDLDRSKIFQPIVGAVLGVVLLFLGLDFMKLASGLVKQYEWIRSVLSVASHSYILGLLTAAVIAFFIQSAATVSAIAIALAGMGILSLEASVAIVYGTNLGPGISVWLLSKKLAGPSRQIAVFQVIFKLLTLVLFLILFYVEIYLKVPLIIAFLKYTFSELSLQLAIAYLLFQIVGAVCFTFLIKPLGTALVKLYPESKEDRLSKPKFINEEILKEPEMATILLEKEELRVAERLCNYLDGVRSEVDQTESNRLLHSSTIVLCKKIEDFFEILIKRNLTHALAVQLLNLENRLELLMALEESLYEMVLALKNHELSVAIANFVHSIVEATQTMLLAWVDLLQKNTKEDRLVVKMLTSDRSELIQKIHDELREANPQLNLKEQQVFDLLSSRFERIVWILRYYGRYVEDARSEEK